MDQNDVPDFYTDSVQMGVSPFGVVLTSGTHKIPVEWTAGPQIPFQWDHTPLQEVLEAIDRGIQEATRGEGRIIEDGELTTDDG